VLVDCQHKPLLGRACFTFVAPVMLLLDGRLLHCLHKPGPPSLWGCARLRVEGGWLLLSVSRVFLEVSWDGLVLGGFKGSGQVGAGGLWLCVHVSACMRDSHAGVYARVDAGCAVMTVNVHRRVRDARL
jgi:hypothetical protein